LLYNGLLLCGLVPVKGLKWKIKGDGTVHQLWTPKQVVVGRERVLNETWSVECWISITGLQGLRSLASNGTLTAGFYVQCRTKRASDVVDLIPASSVVL